MTRDLEGVEERTW